MMSIADVVHKSQCQLVQESLACMILDDDSFTGHPDGFLQKLHRIIRVVQYVNEHDDIETSVVVRKYLSVKPLDRDVSLPAGEDVQTSYCDIRTLPDDPMRK